MTMEIGRITGCTRVCGQNQGFLGLPLRDDVINDSVMGPTNFMTSAWFPTPEQIADIVAGAPVHVSIAGSIPAPMFVTTGDPPD